MTPLWITYPSLEGYETRLDLRLMATGRGRKSSSVRLGRKGAGATRRKVRRGGPVACGKPLPPPGFSSPPHVCPRQFRSSRRGRAPASLIRGNRENAVGCPRQGPPSLFATVFAVFFCSLACGRRSSVVGWGSTEYGALLGRSLSCGSYAEAFGPGGKLVGAVDEGATGSVFFLDRLGARSTSSATG
jgi:hypothetical protein